MEQSWIGRLHRKICRNWLDYQPHPKATSFYIPLSQSHLDCKLFSIFPVTQAMSGHPYSSSFSFPPFPIVFISCLHLKLSHRQKCKSPRSASSCGHCLPEGDHAQQGTGQVWDWQYRQKRKQWSSGGGVRKWLLYLSIKKGSNSSILKFKMFIFAMGCVGSHAHL